MSNENNNTLEPLTEEDALVASTPLPEDLVPAEANDAPNEIIPVPSKSADDQKRYETENYVYLQPDNFNDEGFSKTQILYDLIRQLRNGGDLYKISLPSALLAPVSMLEYIANYLPPHDYLLKVSKQLDPEQRFLTILKWWMSNLTSTPKKGIYHAKPYNAVLGEYFRCKFYHEDSTTHFLAEQVSHHPPITCFVLANRDKNFSVSATVRPKSKFHGNSASTLLQGDILCSITNLKESYIVQFPWVLARGLILGTQSIEVYEKLKITCEQTGFSATVEFLSNNGNKLVGEVKKGGDVVYKISGAITEKVIMTSVATKKSMTLVDAAQVHKVNKYVKVLGKQAEYESRRMWHKVTYAIKKSDYANANAEKHVLEQAQRDLRKKREQNNEQHVTKFFKKVNDNHWKCDIFESEKRLDEHEMFAMDEDEVDYVAKLFPNHKSLKQ